MSYDIYGNTLRCGFCEVHPWVEMPFPCSECYHVDEEARRMKRDQDAYGAQLEREYYAQLEREYLEETEITGLCLMGLS